MRSCTGDWNWNFVVRPFPVTEQGGFLCSCVRDLKPLYESNVNSVGNDGNGGSQREMIRFSLFIGPRKVGDRVWCSTKKHA